MPPRPRSPVSAVSGMVGSSMINVHSAFLFVSLSFVVFRFQGGKGGKGEAWRQSGQGHVKFGRKNTARWVGAHSTRTGALSLCNCNILDDLRETTRGLTFFIFRPIFLHGVLLLQGERLRRRGLLNVRIFHPFVICRHVLRLVRHQRAHRAPQSEVCVRPHTYMYLSPGMGWEEGGVGDLVSTRTRHTHPPLRSVTCSTQTVLCAPGEEGYMRYNCM